MPLSLKAKLERLSGGAAAPAEARPQTVLEYVESVSAPEALFRLPAVGLRGMDFPEDFDPRGALFLDTETNGLRGGAGTVAFLVGLGRIEGDKFTVFQYMMTGYGAEALLLEKVRSMASGASSIVTFNGRSFDVPLLQNRFVMCRMADCLGHLPHLDLIYPARRVWKMRLKDCTLSHIEEKALGIHREGDIPGSEVPRLYFDYLKTGDIAPLLGVVEHNRQDIVSLGVLLAKLADVYAHPTEQVSMMDVFSLGKAAQRRGDARTAAACYHLAARERPLSTMERLRERAVTPQAKARLSLILKREGDAERARALWRDMIERRQMGIFPYVELAKAEEHLSSDPREALRLTEAALKIAEEKDIPALQRRKDRLAARVREQDQ